MSGSATVSSICRSRWILRGCEVQGLLDYEKWATTTVAELLGQMADINAGSVRIVLGKDGQAAGAIVLMHGKDTPAYLEALDAKERELDNVDDVRAN